MNDFIERLQDNVVNYKNYILESNTKKSLTFKFGLHIVLIVLILASIVYNKHIKSELDVLYAAKQEAQQEESNIVKETKEKSHEDEDALNKYYGINVSELYDSLDAVVEGISYSDSSGYNALRTQYLPKYANPDVIDSMFPPENITEFDGQSISEIDSLHEYMVSPKISSTINTNDMSFISVVTYSTKLSNSFRVIYSGNISSDGSVTINSIER